MSAAERFKYYPPLLSVTFPRKYTIEEYLQMVEQTDEKLEYVNGCIVTAEMGGSYSHTLIASNIVALLHTALRGKPCRSHNGDFKIKTKTSFRFADAFVVCGEPQFTSDKKTSLTNPTGFGRGRFSRKQSPRLCR
jgi:Uma2 family endonuclease